MKSDLIGKKIATLKKEIQGAKLVAVSKLSSIEEIDLAIKAKQYDFGENRVNDLLEKAVHFSNLNISKIKWHFIGNLQTKKIKELFSVPDLYAIHSVDSIRLLEEMLKKENELKSKEVKVFFQINTSHESEKNGFESIEELKLAIGLLLKRAKPKLVFYGLMTMGTIRTDNFEAEAKRCFSDLARIGNEIKTHFNLKEKVKLSMGMSSDYKLAITEGSDYVRIGSAIFK